MPGTSRWGGLFLKPFIKELSRRRLPKIQGKTHVNGLMSDVEIIRDEWGLAHIYAENIHDLMFAQGYVHAQDRLFQMELNRLVSRGRLSRVIGEKALDNDRTARTLGYERIAREDWKLIGEQEQRLIDDYCLGINAYMGSKDFKLPVEFSLLGYKPSLWEAIDVMSFSKMLISLLTQGWYDEIVRSKLVSAVGFNVAKELFNTYPKENPSTLSKNYEFNVLDVDAKFNALKGPFIPQVTGSNAWVVHGDRSETGQPFLCNDPHLLIKNPNIWYMNHLHCPDLHVGGVSAPGLPLVLIGHNDQIGWGITLSFSDIEDLFIEKFSDETCTSYWHQGELKKTRIREEKIQIKGSKKAFTEKIYETIHGTIISDIVSGTKEKLALCSMALRPGTALKGWFLLNQAKHWNDFVQGVSHISAPGLNIVYADVQGHIGYYNSGKVPIRTWEDAAIPQAGDSGIADWKDFVPFDQMPYTLNPEKGYIITANNKVEAEDYPYFLGDIYINGYRAHRLEAMIDCQTKLNVSDFEKMQMDFYCTPGKAFAELYSKVKTDEPDLQFYIRLLSDWDGFLTADKIEGSLYELVKKGMMKRIITASMADDGVVNEVLGKGYHPVFGPFNSFVGHHSSILLRLLKNENSIWVKAAGGKDFLLKQCLKDAIDWLQNKYGNQKHLWKWGNLHKMFMKHALSAEPVLEKVFDVGPYAMGGDADTPFQTNYEPEKFSGELNSASYRQIIDFSDFDRTKVIMPLGNSSNIASRYFNNQTQDWYSGKYIPLCWSKHKVKQHHKETLFLKKIG